MNADFYSPLYGKIKWRDSLAHKTGHPILPLARVYLADGEYGRILLQEVKGERFLLRYYIFEFLQQMTLLSQERSEGMQSLLSLKGMIGHGVRGRKIHLINEGQFTLYKADGAETETIISAGKPCHLLNTYYPEGAYSDLLPLFPSLKRDLKKAGKGPRFFLPFPRPARYTVMDAVREILRERYQLQLQKSFWEMKLKESLFTQLAQAYTEEPEYPLTPLDQERVRSVKQIIEQDIKKHYPNDELARMVDWSESSLKRAFRQEYGMGMYEYLRSLRMQKARELLLQGEQVKNVAPAVGMRASNFTMEFQKYFGYKATSLRSAKR